jgi:hypothetical protein
MYRVDTDALAEQQVEALPPSALPAFAELRTLLEVDPWAGNSINSRNPDAAVRNHVFGEHHEGVVTYLILDDQRRVDLLSVLWLG